MPPCAIVPRFCHDASERMWYIIVFKIALANRSNLLIKMGVASAQNSKYAHIRITVDSSSSHKLFWVGLSLGGEGRQYPTPYSRNHATKKQHSWQLLLPPRIANDAPSLLASMAYIVHMRCNVHCVVRLFKCSRDNAHCCYIIKHNYKQAEPPNSRRCSETTKTPHAFPKRLSSVSGSAGVRG